jgi:hypothetical protein
MTKTIENVISEGFELVRKNYLKFLSLYILFVVILSIIILVAVVFAVLFIFGSGLNLNNISGIGSALGPIVFLLIVVLAIMFIVEPLWIGSYYAMALQYLNGGTISVFDAIGKARQKYVPLLWTMALETLIFVVIDVLIFSPLVVPAASFFHVLTASSSLSGSAVIRAGIPLLLLGIVMAIVFLLVTLVLAPLLYEAVPLVMLENVRGVKAIKESIDIGRKTFWNLIWLFVLFGIVYGLIELGQGMVTFVLNLLGLLAGSILGIIISLFVGAFVTAWLYVLPIIFYRDFLDKKG